MAQKERYELQKSNKNFIEIFDNVRDRWITEDNICELLNDYNKEIKELEEENQQLIKALELACERVKYFEEMQDKEMGFYEFFGYDSDYDLKALIEQYKQQAKEMLENE